MTPTAEQAAVIEPISISITRQVAPGREQDYEAWLKGITAAALSFPGHMGVNVIRPNAPSREYVTIFRFDSYQHSRAWEESPQRRQWLDQLEGIVEGSERVQKGTGLEFWFSLPELPAAHPSPHKMVVVLFVVVSTLVMLLNLLWAPVITDWPMPAKVPLIVLCQVVLMTYVVMPRITRWLKGWLFR